MRAAVVFFSPASPTGSRGRLLELARALARGIESQGHTVDLIDGYRDTQAKLTMYQYIAIGVEPASSFGGKIPERVGQFLGSSGLVSGKRSFAFVPKNLIGSGRALSRLMKSMEKEGMYLKNSQVFATPQEAKETGRKLHIQR